VMQCITSSFPFLYLSIHQSNSASAAITAELAVVQRSLLDTQQRLSEVEEALSEGSSKYEILKYVI
jgi:hypothetical protein